MQVHPPFTQKALRCCSWPLLVGAARQQKPEAAEGDVGGHLIACAEKGVWQHRLGRGPSRDPALPSPSARSRYGVGASRYVASYQGGCRGPL